MTKITHFHFIPYQNEVYLVGNDERIYTNQKFTGGGFNIRYPKSEDMTVPALIETAIGEWLICHPIKNLDWHEDSDQVRIKKYIKEVEKLNAQELVDSVAGTSKPNG